MRVLHAQIRDSSLREAPTNETLRTNSLPILMRQRFHTLQYSSPSLSIRWKPHSDDMLDTVGSELSTPTAFPTAY